MDLYSNRHGSFVVIVIVGEISHRRWMRPAQPSSRSWSSVLRSLSLDYWCLWRSWGTVPTFLDWILGVWVVTFGSGHRWQCSHQSFRVSLVARFFPVWFAVVVVPAVNVCVVWSIDVLTTKKGWMCVAHRTTLSPVLSIHATKYSSYCNNIIAVALKVERQMLLFR